MSRHRSDFTASLNRGLRRLGAAILPSLVVLGIITSGAGASEVGASFEGKYFAGSGDTGYLKLLETARRMFEPDPELQYMAMLYTPTWNGFVEGPTWDAWWIQNSYGTTYCALPFWQEPYITFVQNSQDLWFDQMGDGHHVGGKPWLWVGPDGCLCDAARPGWIFYKQGDGRIAIHDWGMEFTAAGVVLQAEALLIEHDRTATLRYLPKLERCADFLESRRDPANNLYLAGPAGNLLAPSYAGYRKPDGTYGKAYLAGLSVTTIAALDRLIELEKTAGRDDKVRIFTERRALSRMGLPLITTAEGYFIKSLDPDGTPHGVYGAARHGYFETVVNHDAICFRVSDNEQSRKIYAKLASIPGLRPYDLIITNYPSLDDMYVEPTTGIWRFGCWVNGGHWSTCEARMIMAYYRLGRTDDARRSMERILGYARRFRMDNPLTDFGNGLYQPATPINCVYDAWGIPAAFIRGLFEYLYQSDSLVVVPHIPPGITRLEQKFPIRFGRKSLYLSTEGTGRVTAVTVNGKSWASFDPEQINLPYDSLPADAAVRIGLGGAGLGPRDPAGQPTETAAQEAVPIGEASLSILPSGLGERLARVGRFDARLVTAGLADTYIAAHARLVLDCRDAFLRRTALVATHRIPALPPASQAAADRSYVETLDRVCSGLEKVLKSYGDSPDLEKRAMANLWSLSCRP